MAKGAPFERLVCKQLSLWLSNGKRDDLLWRSSQSGGRATQRAKSGKKTAGHAGDICSTDPSSEWLTKFVTWEAKDGYGGTKRAKKGKTVRKVKPSEDATVAGILDALPSQNAQGLELFILQAMAAAERAGSLIWAVVHKRNARRAVVYFPAIMWGLSSQAAPFIDCRFYTKTKPRQRISFIAMPFDAFLKLNKPKILKARIGNYYAAKSR